MFESWSSKFKLGAFLLATGIVIRTVLGLSTKEDEEIQKAKEIMKKARKERRKKRFYAFLAGTASLVAGYKCTSIVITGETFFRNKFHSLFCSIFEHGTAARREKSLHDMSRELSRLMRRCEF